MDWWWIGGGLLVDVRWIGGGLVVEVDVQWIGGGLVVDAGGCWWITGGCQLRLNIKKFAKVG